MSTTRTTTAPLQPATVSKIVTFRLAEDLFAADIYSVERVLRYQTPTPVPNVPEWIDGVIDYQGRVVPLINLRRRFDSIRQQGRRRRPAHADVADAQGSC